MIKSFANKLTRDIYDGTDSRYSRKLQPSLHAKVQRLLDQINASPSLEFLRIPPSNRFEKLSGNLSGFWSLRINIQWRIIFQWEDDDAYNVQIIDYH
ncbi:MAG: type II toxin-antitoxin system RelE/ParE family toxin [Candidatus Aminicenantes bacterium]|nr:type II toxin-antitoxin system RelE/ParE family toxin [Acidobacteriota bacterium]MCG2816423.1 type II toxin-antitoxin system RelE/ParE family toxin [Candidatus Aminicenantes bacterium]